ncbi:MAG: AI-2E family transporter, partial [Gemmatimonadetes bacterium]|nr:AI-2E family transporter [Gemmatimonadota bacterium]NIQ55615.1 AI-2E family transporter [Gemmatimonadota bacterium]NIU75824.1 AI-2E family transporter [Gammaproteobacteria bacterium]NIX45461.1 AI-2E family transporter [Gemmatimonadota bacterium]
MARVASYVPRPQYDRWTAFVAEYDRLLSRYLRGQVLAAAIVGVLTWIGLWIAGFPYSGLVGAVAGVFNVVPYLGLPVSLIPAIIIAILSGSFLTSLLKVAIVFAIV